MDRADDAPSSGISLDTSMRTSKPGHIVILSISPRAKSATAGRSAIVSRNAPILSFICVLCVKNACSGSAAVGNCGGENTNIDSYQSRASRTLLFGISRARNRRSFFSSSKKDKNKFSRVSFSLSLFLSLSLSLSLSLDLSLSLSLDLSTSFSFWLTHLFTCKFDGTIARSRQ